jgi:hypothetical protein
MSCRGFASLLFLVSQSCKYIILSRGAQYLVSQTLLGASRFEAIMQKYIILSWEPCCLASQFLRACRDFAAIKSIAGREAGPLRARQIDIIEAVGAALDLTLESVLALEKGQVPALEVPKALGEVALLDERLLGDACATLFAGC